MYIRWLLGLLAISYIGLALVNSRTADQSWWYRSTMTDVLPHAMGSMGVQSAACMRYLFGDLVWIVLLVAILLVIIYWKGKVTSEVRWQACRLVSLMSVFFLLATDLFNAYIGGAFGYYLYRCLYWVIPVEYVSVVIGCSAGLMVILCGGVQVIKLPVQRMTSLIFWSIYSIMQRLSISLYGLLRAPFVRSRVAPEIVKKETISRKKPPEQVGAAQKKIPPSSLYDTIFTTTVHADRSALDARCRVQAEVLYDKLLQFGIRGKIVSVTVGPVIVMFEYQPEHNVPLTKIIAREADLALALRVSHIRIIAPIPGKALVGFECAHTERTTISFAQGIAQLLKEERRKQIPLFFGVTTSEDPYIIDLTALPHVLVAGSTGSGKSVALHAMIMSIIGTRSQEETRLIMIDPKRLEFAPYVHIPHLLTPIVHDAKQALEVLRWVVSEMERRYEQLAQTGYKDCASYRAAGNHDMAYIVVIIDEWADLMMTGGKDVEALIVRLAQMSRAAGIHLIIATQRPSVDVITGLIKVNVPARLAFRVVSKIDSRTIIDRLGAEQLLGRGDMLFMGVEPVPIRLHGAYVTTDEIEAMVQRIRQQGEPLYVDMTSHATDCDMPEEDAVLYQQVVSLVRSLDEVSISLLQRKLRIGYNRSARMISYLEAQGVILPADGSKTRRVVR
jgi:S-DNA-T family DNA segregation ATPase FtsK/SpoIIIE